MGFDYVTNSDEKILSPFFSPRMISVTFKSTLLIGIIMIVSWPNIELVSYIRNSDYPVLFSRTFIAAIIIKSYLNIRCGRGELYAEENIYKLKTGETTPNELEKNFFSYGLIQAILHNVLLMFFMLPILAVSASTSGISISTFCKACLVLFTSSMACRMFGFLVYPFYRKNSGIGYIIIRILYLFFMFATLYLAPYVNPIRIVNYLHSGETMIIFGNINPYQVYMLTVWIIILFLVIANYFMVRNFSSSAKTMNNPHL
jgi:hypothetical protein